MFTHSDVFEAIIGWVGLLLAIKDNHPALGRDIEAAFAEPEPGLSSLQVTRG